MCGICGLVSLDGGPVDAAPLAEMSALLAHRGPDSAGELVDGPVALAARRLAIVDLEGGDQPIANEAGDVVVVQNGEIYNQASLRDGLERRGHRFRSRADTEVLVHLYEDLGPEFVRELRGMFALALWDRRARRLLLARDRFGIKPLFWSAGANVLAFASELDALRHVPGVGDAISADALHAYLAFNSVPAPLTILRDASKLPPGHLLIWSPSGPPAVHRYARPRPAPVGGLRREPEADLAAELRDRLGESVRAHLMADVPVGVLLSGGVDSGALTALAAQAGGGPLHTFSIGFRERSFDELPLARRMARRYGTRHHELVVEPDIAAVLGQLARAFDEPSGDSSAVPTFLVSGLAAGEVKVVLSGEGGDELFGGYETYAADLLAQRLRGAATIARPLVERLPSSSRRVSFEYRAKRFTAAAHLPPLERHHAWKEINGALERDWLLTPPWRGAADPVDVLRVRYAETAGAPTLARLQDVDLGIYLADDLLVKTDRCSMFHSLETRVPFLDPVVADFALALPTRLKVRGLSKKRLLRAAVAPLLPAEILRARKRGFSIPAAAWLRGDLQPFARDVLAPARVRSDGFFDPQAVSRLLDDHARRRADHSRRLWGLLSFGLWLEARRTTGARERRCAA